MDGNLLYFKVRVLYSNVLLLHGCNSNCSGGREAQAGPKALNTQARLWMTICGTIRNPLLKECVLNKHSYFFILRSAAWKFGQIELNVFSTTESRSIRYESRRRTYVVSVGNVHYSEHVAVVVSRHRSARTTNAKEKSAYSSKTRCQNGHLAPLL